MTAPPYSLSSEFLDWLALDTAAPTDLECPAMALLALCGERHELSVRMLPLSADVHQAVAEAFANQEATFRGCPEAPFDENWLNEGKEISTTPIPEDVDVFSEIWQSTDTSLQPVDHIQEIRGLAMGIVSV